MTSTSKKFYNEIVIKETANEIAFSDIYRYINIYRYTF